MSRTTIPFPVIWSLLVAVVGVGGCALPKLPLDIEPKPPRELPVLPIAARRLESSYQEHSVQQTSFEQADEPPTPGNEHSPQADQTPIEAGSTKHKTPIVPGADAHPIDLSTALALGGASHLQIQLARERVIEANANLLAARALWLPALRFGIGWNKHDGKLQETEGTIREVNRNSLFVGGGAGLGLAPSNGAASGPARFFVDLSLADVLFAPLVAERMADAENAAQAATVNDSLLEIAIAYFNLVEAHGELANAEFCREMAQRLVKLTQDFADTGAGSPADVDRATVELAQRQQQVQDARRVSVARSAELARLLRLGPETTLTPVEERVMPIDLIDPGTPLDSLLAQGLGGRPELAQAGAAIEAAERRSSQEFWRPWLPNLHVGATAGSFGGGPSTTFQGQGSRSDLDVLAVWEVQGLGYGVRAQRLRRETQARQAELQAGWVRDRIVSEIATAANDVRSYREQMEVAMQSVESAGQSYRRNFQRVREGDGLPVELLQAIRARCESLTAYTRAVSDYNRAQFRLLRSLGQPPGAPAP